MSSLTKFIIILSVPFFIIFLLLRYSFGWKKTVKKVAKRYQDISDNYLDLSEKEIFFKVLDLRYPENAATKYLYQEKEKIKEEFIKEIGSNSKVFKNYKLPTLAFVCLLIERNSILRKKDADGIKKLIKEIRAFLEKEGFKKYL